MPLRAARLYAKRAKLTANMRQEEILVEYCNTLMPLGRILRQAVFAAQMLLLRVLQSAAGASRDSELEREELNRRAEALLDAHGNSVLRLAYSYLHNSSDAEEVLQDTLISFMRAAPVLENERHERAWLLRVATNLCKNRLLYNKKHDTDELRESLAADEQEDLSFVWDAVKALPEKYREVIHLFYYEGYSTAETARILGQKESTVRSCLHRGRERLRDILKEAYDFE